MNIKKEPVGKWTIENTEFILRLLSNTTIPGADVEQATAIMKKFKNIHQQLLSYEVTE